MIWIFFAILAHIGNALVFAVDKSLLETKSVISQPLRYAFLSGLIAGLAIIILPFTYAPLSVFVVVWSTVAGAFHLFALWLFFNSLKNGEPSRIVPIAGSSVPAFTAVFAVSVLGEILNLQLALAVLVLILGGALLSVHLKKVSGIKPKVLMTTVISGLFFAAYFATVKYLYDNSNPFLSVFVYSRVIESLLALIILGPLVLTLKPTSLKKAPTTNPKLRVAAAFAANKVLAAGAFALQSYALSLGSVTVVNSLQGSQYLFLLFIAFLVSKKAPHLFREEFGDLSLIQKTSGIVLVSLGLALLIT